MKRVRPKGRRIHLSREAYMKLHRRILEFQRARHASREVTIAGKLVQYAFLLVKTERKVMTTILRSKTKLQFLK